MKHAPSQPQMRSRYPLLALLCVPLLLLALGSAEGQAPDTLVIDFGGPTRAFERPIASGIHGGLRDSLEPRSLFYDIRPSMVRGAFSRHHWGGHDLSWGATDSAEAVAAFQMWPSSDVSEFSCGCPHYGSADTSTNYCDTDPLSQCWGDHIRSLNTDVDAVLGRCACPDSLEGLPVHWGVWNEPDLEMFWDGGPAAFLDLWHTTYDSLKFHDSTNVVTGPHNAYGPFGRDDGSDPFDFTMRQFLEFADDNACLPDVLVWHSTSNRPQKEDPDSLFAVMDIEAQVDELREALEGWDVDQTWADTVMMAVPEAMGNYSTTEDRVGYLDPGLQVRMFATAERAADKKLMYAGRAYYNQVAGDYSTGHPNTDYDNGRLAGLIDSTSANPRYGWYAYKAYAGLNGDILTNVSGTEHYDVLATIGSGDARALVGRYSDEGADSIVVFLDGLDDFVVNGVVEVSVDRFRGGRAHRYSAFPISSAADSIAVASFSRRYPVDNGELTLTLSGQAGFESWDAVSVVVRSPSIVTITAAQEAIGIQGAIDSLDIGDVVLVDAAAFDYEPITMTERMRVGAGDWPTIHKVIK